MQNLLVRTCIGKFIVMWHNNYDEKTFWTPVVITKKQRNKNKELEDEFQGGIHISSYFCTASSLKKYSRHTRSLIVANIS